MYVRMQSNLYFRWFFGSFLVFVKILKFVNASVPTFRYVNFSSSKDIVFSCNVLVILPLFQIMLGL